MQDNNNIQITNNQIQDNNTQSNITDGVNDVVQVAQPAQPISVGTPEAPININSNQEVSKPESVEYGYESIKNLENAPQPIESAERKEKPIAPKQKKQQSIQTKQPKPIKTVPVNRPKQPSFFGYKIPPQIANNTANIIAQKGKGDTAEARTWIYMLLDRLMKKQAAN